MPSISPLPVVSWASTSKCLERPLQVPPKEWEDERESHHNDEGDRDVPQQIVWQAKSIEKCGRGKRERREAKNQAGDNGIGPAPRSARAAREDDRKHGQDARRDGRDKACNERDADKCCHGAYSECLPTPG